MTASTTPTTPPTFTPAVLPSGEVDLFGFDYSSLDLNTLTKEERRQALEKIQALERLRKENAVRKWFPPTGPLRRELYTKHMEFFRLGAQGKTERLFIAANRVGKSVTAAVELAYHVTGLYPDWWEGFRFTKGIKVYVAGKTGKNTRDICQFKLMGEYDAPGTGTIPKHTLIGDPTPKPGIPKAYEMVQVRHTSGDTSIILFKSFDQGWEAFMGTEIDLAWEDEEPPEDVHSEILVRLMTTNGHLMLTFTPLEGMTKVVKGYISSNLQADQSRDHVAVVNCGWNDVPHLSESQKQRLMASTPPHLRRARSEGIPSLGAGAVYPVEIESIEIDDFQLPEYWPRAYALDVGWRRTAALWMAWDRESDVMYLYSEHYEGQALPAIHADAIRARGEWIPGLIDPAARNRTQDDGQRLMTQYVDCGLDLSPADNAVEAGIQAVWNRMAYGKLKVFKSLRNFWSELQLYQRDKNGKLVKENDHLMDCMKYLALKGTEIARVHATKVYARRQAAGADARWAL